MTLTADRSIFFRLLGLEHFLVRKLRLRDIRILVSWGARYARELVAQPNPNDGLAVLISRRRDSTNQRIILPSPLKRAADLGCL